MFEFVLYITEIQNFLYLYINLQYTIYIILCELDMYGVLVYYVLVYILYYTLLHVFCKCINSQVVKC